MHGTRNFSTVDQGRTSHAVCVLCKKQVLLCLLLGFEQTHKHLSSACNLS